MNKFDRCAPLMTHTEELFLDDLISMLDDTLISTDVDAGQLVFQPKIPWCDKISSEFIDNNNLLSNTSCNTSDITSFACSFSNFIRRLFALYIILMSWRIRNDPLKCVIDLARIKTMTTMMTKYMDLNARVKRMDVTAFSSSVIQARLDLLKYVVPRRPSQSYLECIMDILRMWVCKTRLKNHCSGKKTYPITRIREAKQSDTMSGFVWVNPIHKKRWGRLLNTGATPRRIRNAPCRGHGPPDDTDWVHCYLMGKYIKDIPTDTTTYYRQKNPSHESAMTIYSKQYNDKNWYGTAMTAWKFEYDTYSTDQFYHDYHMGYITNQQRRVLSNKTRKTRAMSEFYRKKYLLNISQYERKTGK